MIEKAAKQFRSWLFRREIFSVAYYCCHPTVIRSWWKHWKTLPVYLWVRAARSFQSGDFFGAARYYEAGLKRHNLHPAARSARLDLAYCLYRQGEFAQASRELEALTAGIPDFRDALLLLSRIQFFLGLKNSALSLISRCVRAHPTDLRVLCAYVHIAGALGEERDKLVWAKEQLELWKERLPLLDDKNVIVDTALSYFELHYGDLLQGERMLVRVLATGKAPYEALLMRGEGLLEEGRQIQARDLLGRAARLAPYDPRPLVHLARSYLGERSSRSGRWALDHAREACRRSLWKNTECLDVLAEAYEACRESSVAGLVKNLSKQVYSSQVLERLEVSEVESDLEQLRNRYAGESC